MTMTTTTDDRPVPLASGDVFHVVSSGLTIGLRPGDGTVLERGQTWTVTDDMLEANRDREGRSVLDLVDDEPAQVTRFGQVMIRRAQFPADEPTADPGTRDWAEQREQARRSAWLAPSAELRAAALRAVDERFGPAPSTNLPTAHYASDEDIRERRDEERREAQRLRHH